VAGTLGTFGTGTVSSIANVGDGSYLIAATFTAAAISQVCSIYPSNSASDGFAPGNTSTGSFELLAGGTFNGSFTAAQILAMGGIPWTMETASVSLSLGEERVVNGDFSSGLAGWTTEPSASVVNGALVATSSSASNIIASRFIAIPEGKPYYLTANAIAVNSSTAIRLNGTVVSGGYKQAGYWSNVFTAGNQWVLEVAGGAGSSSATIDNISIRELISTPCPIYTNAHAYVPGAGVMVTPANLLTWSRDFNNGVWSHFRSSKVGVTVIDGIPCMEVLLNEYEASVERNHAAIGVVQTLQFMVRSKVPDIKLGIHAGNTDFSPAFDVTTTWTTITYVTKGTANVDSMSLRNKDSVPRYVYIAAAGAFLGTYTAAQLAAMGGIPWTMETPSVSLSLGDERVVNGDFSNGLTGWAKTSPYSIIEVVNNVANITTLPGANWTEGLQQYVNDLTTGKTYYASYNQTSSGRMRMSLTEGQVYSNVATYLKFTALGSITTANFFLDANTAGAVGTLDNISIRELISTPCPVYVSSNALGLAANNYAANTGGSYTVVDSASGLVIDGVANTGPELLTGALSTYGSSTIAVSGDIITITSTGAGTSGVVWNDVSISSTSRYRFALEIVANPQNNNVQVYINTLAQEANLTAATVGPKVCYPVAVASGLSTSHPVITCPSMPTGNSVSIRLVSVKELIGINASQATAGNMPTIARGLVNRLANSHTPANLSKTDCTVSGSTLTTTVAANPNVQNPVLPSEPYTGIPITQVAELSAGNQSVMALQMFVNGGVGGSWVTTDAFIVSGPGSVTFTSAIAIVTGLSSTQRTVVALVGSSSATSGNLHAYVKGRLTGSQIGDTGNCHASACFIGAYTAAQIIAMGGIPTTTTVAASNPNTGPYSWQFMDNTDVLKLDRVPYQSTDDYANVVVCKLEKVPGASKYPYAFAVKGDTYRGAGSIVFDNAGKPMATWNDGTASVSLTHSIAVFGWVVLTAWKVGNTKVLRVNGLQSAVDTTALAPTVLEAAYIGHSGGVDASTIEVNYEFPGLVGKVISEQGTITADELLLIERSLGSEYGVHF
jgi:hypothetical protein